jgi:hypothetical protein
LNFSFNYFNLGLIKETGMRIAPRSNARVILRLGLGEILMGFRRVKREIVDDLPVELIQPLIAALPRNLKFAVLLRTREGLSDQAIARYLRIEKQEVSTLISLARTELLRLSNNMTTC